MSLLKELAKLILASTLSNFNCRSCSDLFHFFLDSFMIVDIVRMIDIILNFSLFSVFSKPYLNYYYPSSIRSGVQYTPLASPYFIFSIFSPMRKIDR